MKHFLTYLFSIIGLYSYAQNIAKDTVLMPGFYKDIQELIDNNPSEPFDYEITKKNIGFFLPDKTELYNLSISKDSTKIIGDIIGFSDGLNIYLKTIRTGVFANFESNKFNEKSNFIKIIDIGVYTFFYDLKKTYNNTTMRSSGGVVHHLDMDHL